MAVVHTSSCRRNGSPEFRITYDPALVPVEDDIRWFIAGIEQAVAAGERFAAGQTYQVGWVVTMIRANQDDTLSLWEPDMRQMPVVWVESVSHTLAHLRIQKDVCESVLPPVEKSFPSIRQSAIICMQLGQTESLVMERVAPSESDSGWFCGCGDSNHDHNSVSELKKVSLYEAAVRHAPQIIPYLALPEGTLLEADERGPSLFRHGVRLRIKPGSFLAFRNRDR